MPSRFIAALFSAGVLLVSNAAHTAHGPADKQAAADKQAEQATVKGKDKPQDGDRNQEDGKPACMHCGATCGLAPVCVCEPDTKKRPKTEFDVTCEPLCVAGCTTRPWFLDWCRDRTTCTSCCEEPCECPGRVRWCRRLKRETVDEEVPTIVRKVKYVCRCCSGACSAGCCGAERRCRPLPAWWTNLTWWWPRKPAG